MVLIIGGGKRIGRALVKAYAKDHRVLSTYHTNRPKLVGNERAVALDLSDLSQIKFFAQSLESKSISRLLYVSSTFYRVSFGKTLEREWNDLVDVNLKAAYFLCEALQKKFKRGADIQFFNDVLVDRLPIELLPYAVAKAGLSTLMRTLAFHFAPHVRVNEIRLGYALPPDRSSAAEKAQWLKEIPLKEFTGVEAVVAASRYIASESNLTGAQIDLDGGLSLRR